MSKVNAAFLAEAAESRVGGQNMTYNTNVELEKQKSRVAELEKKLADLQTERTKELPKCMICKDDIELPVTLNVLKCAH